MNDPLPALVSQNVPAPLGDRHLIPALIADLGEPASWRYVEFFTANIRNVNTRHAYPPCYRIHPALESCATTTPVTLPIPILQRATCEERRQRPRRTVLALWWRHRLTSPQVPFGTILASTR
jgi:hypothetical protein